MSKTKPTQRELHPKEHGAWRYMRTRCTNPNFKDWDRYGGRGITICSRWDKFENFLEDMGPKPSDKHSLDRIDNDGPYAPGNCRWATATEQVCNNSKTHFLEFRGKKQPAKVWAKEVGINYLTLLDRLQSGWDVERALTQKVRQK